MYIHVYTYTHMYVFTIIHPCIHKTHKYTYTHIYTLIYVRGGVSVCSTPFILVIFVIMVQFFYIFFCVYVDSS